MKLIITNPIKKPLNKLLTNTTTTHPLTGEKTRIAQGFTLVEVLVALAVLAVTAAAASSAAMNYTSTLIRMQQKTLGEFVAQNTAVNMQLEQQWLTGESTRQVTEQGHDWQITSKSEDTGDDTVRRITINVALKESPEADAKNMVQTIIFISKPQS